MFWDNFSKACESKNIKPTPLAQKLGLSSSSATAWKKRPPNAETLLLLADYLDVSIDYLLGRTESPELCHSKSITVSGNNQISTNGSNSISISESEKLDEMSSELLKKFNELSFDDKLDIFNYIKNKKET